MKSMSHEDVEFLKKIILSEPSENISNELFSTRVAKRFLEIKQRENKEKISIKNIENDALFDILHLPRSENVKIFKNDIRGLILRSSLISIIKEASCFSIVTLKRKLGNKFLKNMKPIGFSDFTKKTILLATKSATVTFEMNFYKAEILKKLQSIKEFSELKNIKFIVKH